jgi:hypothetical protein
MIDHSRQKNKKGTRLTILGTFTPVPRERERHDGWTPERQRRFIAALADLGSVKAAAHAVNMAPEGAYQLRRHPEASEFRKAWDTALALGVQRLEDVAMDRALNGVEVPVYSYGKLVGTRRKYNDRLLMFLLRTRAKKRFGEDGRMNLADRATLNNLKRQWRKQWEQERALAEVERTKQTHANIEEQIRQWEDRRTQQIARALRAEWLRLGGPPRIPGDKALAWQDEAEDDEPEEDEADYAETDADPDAALAPPSDDPAAEPAAPPAPDEPASHRTVSLKHGWPDDGRATPFYGRW